MCLLAIEKNIQPLYFLSPCIPVRFLLYYNKYIAEYRLFPQKDKEQQHGNNENLSGIGRKRGNSARA